MAQTDSPAKSSFVLYCDLLQKLERLTTEQKGLVFQAILEFQNGFEPQIDDPLAQLSFDFIKLDLIKNNEKYQETVNRNRLNGAKGGRPRKDNPENPLGFIKSGGINDIQTGFDETEGLKQKPRKPDNENDNENENDIKNITAGAVTNFYEKFEAKGSSPLLGIGRPRPCALLKISILTWMPAMRKSPASHIKSRIAGSGCSVMAAVRRLAALRPPIAILPTRSDLSICRMM